MSGTERQPAEDPEFRRLGTCADVVIKAALVACGASVVVCLNAYGLRPESYLLSALSPVLYYALAAIGLLLLLSLKLRTHVRIGVAITIVMAAVGLYTLEGLLTWFGGADRLLRQSGVLAATAGVEFDTRDRLAVLASLERRGLPAVPNINPANVLRADGNGLLTSTLEIEDVEILPLAGISMKRTLYCNESGQYVIYESDEHGFHNPRGLWSASRIDVAAVGDSFVQGSCVPSEQNIMGIIQRAHPLALNLGMVNNGPLAALATLKEYVPPLKPAIVLWFYFEGNDLEDLARERRTPKLTSYLQGGFTQQLARQQAEIDRALTRYVDAARVAEQQRRYGHPAGLIQALTPAAKLEKVRERLGFASHVHKRDPELPENMALFTRILAEAKACVETWNGRLYFVYLPEWLRYSHPKAASGQRDAVLRMARSAGIPVIDIDPVFRADGDPLALFPFRRMGGHYNEKGYRLVAEEVLRSINSRESPSLSGSVNAAE